MMKSNRISINLIYSLIVQISGFVTPLVTSPYVARALSPELIGDYSFTLANSNYFAMFECMGLSLYGMIETAKARDDKEKLSNLFWEISLLKLLLTAVSIGIFIVFICFSAERHKQLYLIMIFNLIAVGIDTTWFLSGLEEFKITAIRSVAIRVITVVLILCFVKSESDIVKYAAIMQSSTFVSYAVMFPAAVRKTVFISLRELNPWKHIKVSLVYFVPGIITTIFSSTDKSILGFFATSYEVGVYEQAQKICQLFVGMISAVSNAILPRAAYFNSNGGKTVESEKLFKTSVQICYITALPICFGISAIADNFIPLFFGAGYEKSAVLLKILCVNVFFIALSNFYGQQALIARGKQKEYNISVTISALANVVMNLIMVKDFESPGVSAASAISAAIGLLMISYYGKDMMSLSMTIGISKKYLAAAVLMFLCIFRLNIINSWFTVVVQIVTGAAIYAIILIILKEEFVCQRLAKIRNRSRFLLEICKKRSK